MPDLTLPERLRHWMHMIDARRSAPHGDDARLHALLREAATALEAIYAISNRQSENRV